MGLFDDVVDFAKKNFIPKDISLEGFASTPAAQAAMQAAMMATPGVPLGLAAAAKMAEATGLDRAPDTRIKIPFSDKYTTPRAEARHLMEALDATGPGSGLDDVLMAGAKAGMPVVQKLMRMMEASPESMAVVAPLISKLGIVKPRGAAYIPGVHHFESKLAEALDKKFIAPGNPEDLISLKEIRAELGKLPGAGVKKEELSHFNLGPQIESMLSQGKTKISREELATLIDKRMPRVEVVTDTERHRGYTLPSEGRTYNPPDYKSYIFHAPPAGVSPDELGRLDISEFANSISKTRDEMLARVQDDFNSGRISQNVYDESVQSVNQMFENMAASYGGRVEPFKDIEGSTSAGHYDQARYPNILGWARTTRREFGAPPPPVVGDDLIPSPETAKYIEEIQSDWASKARKSGNEESAFPLSNVNDLVMRYIDRISREAGEEAVGWTPPSAQIARWSGSKKLTEKAINEPWQLNIEPYIESLGKKPLTTHTGDQVPEESLTGLKDFLSNNLYFKSYERMTNSPEGQAAMAVNSAHKSFQNLIANKRLEYQNRNTPPGIRFYQLPAGDRERILEESIDYSRNHPEVKKALEALRGIGEGQFFDTRGYLTSKGFDLTQKLLASQDLAVKSLNKYIEKNPVTYPSIDERNFSGFESNYGEKLPAAAKRIIGQRGGGKVFNERIAGNPEGQIAKQYAERYPESEGYVQPPDIGSFFYRIPKEQRGKPVPYPDSLWGLLGAAGLAGMMEAGKKDRQPQ